MKTNAEKTSRQAKAARRKKPFVVREIPSETLLDARLRNGALRLLGFLWSKADATTGELRIRAHWFEQNELVRMSRKIGISESTFRRIVRKQLIPYGYIREVERKYREQLDRTGRKRKVLGPQYYVVFKSAQEPHKQRPKAKSKAKQPHGERVSTSGQTVSVEDNARPPDDSTSGQNVENSQKGSTSGQSTSLVERPRNTHKPTSCGRGGGVGSGVGNEGGNPFTSSSSKSTNPNPDDDDDVRKEKIERLRRQHPRFVEACERIVLDRASAMGKRVASPDRYFAGALPSLLQEPRLVVEIAYALNMRNLSEAQDLHDAAMETYDGEPTEPAPLIRESVEPFLCYCGEVHKTPDEWESCLCSQCGCNEEDGHVCGWIEEPIPPTDPVPFLQTDNTAAIEVAMRFS